MPSNAIYAQTLNEDTVSIVQATVISATTPTREELPGLGTDVRVSETQDIQARIEDGQYAGQTVSFTNNYVMFNAGDTFYLKRQKDLYTESVYYSVSDPYRLDVLLALLVLFVGICVGIGRWQGFRGVLSLAASIAALYYILVPLILNGYSPVLSSLFVASLIVVVGSYITHGVSRTTSSAVLGMVATIALSGLLAEFAIQYAHLTGYAAEEAVYLTLNTRGTLSLLSLLLGGILIGLLGVLYDSAIGQAVAVEELYRSGQQSGHAHTSAYIWSRAMRIGREHIGALVNTLAIAYVGASLPLLLLVSQASSAPLLVTINSEVFATEIIRIIVGSIGVILAVPITTAIAVYLLRGVTFTTLASHDHHGHRH